MTDYEYFSRVHPDIVTYSDPYFADRVRLLYGKPFATPIDASYTSDVIIVKAKTAAESQEWFEQIKAEARKRPRLGFPFDSDAAVANAWTIYEASRTVPRSQTTADKLRWWLRCRLVEWRVI